MLSSASLVVASDASVSEKTRAPTGETLQLVCVATEDAGTDTEPQPEPAAPTAALKNSFLRTAMIREEAAEAGEIAFLSTAVSWEEMACSAVGRIAADAYYSKGAVIDRVLRCDRVVTFTEWIKWIGFCEDPAHATTEISQFNLQLPGPDEPWKRCFECLKFVHVPAMRSSASLVAASDASDSENHQPLAHEDLNEMD